MYYLCLTSIQGPGLHLSYEKVCLFPIRNLQQAISKYEHTNLASSTEPDASCYAIS